MEVLVAMLDAILNFLVGQWSSVIFSGLNVFLAPTTWGKTKIINFELIVTDLWPFESVGGHF